MLDKEHEKIILIKQVWRVQLKTAGFRILPPRLDNKSRAIRQACVITVKSNRQ